MRVLWLVRKNLTEHPGGDTTQILQTAAALRRRGIEVSLASELGADLGWFDLVHLFHLDRLWENVAHGRRVRAAGLPLALSTIYWPSDEFDRGGRAGFQGWLARSFGSAAYQNLRLFQRCLMHGREQRMLPSLSPRRFSFHRNAVELLESVSVLLPNSRAEQEQIETRFGVRRPTVVVPNAADRSTFGPPPEPGPARAGVLCVGRIEPRKNQLSLIAALRGTGIPLTLVGQSGRFSSAYFRRCQRAADATVRCVGPQPPAELRGLYHAARVHACVSWYETPGLASLEAALCGCALVVTPGGCTREYFGDEAVYAEPDKPAIIRAAVEQALARGPSTGLAQRVAQHYTWETAAQKTAEGYELALRTKT
jgi:glycosyltransferase involved in cell wall biosynthesis